MKDYNLMDRLMSMLYLESMLGLREIAGLFKITPQRVQQRLSRYGTKARRRGNHSGSACYAPWQITLLNRLVRFGLPMTQAADLLSLTYCPNKKIDNEDCIDFSGLGKTKFRNLQITRVWHEFTKMIVVDAWSKGATIKDLSTIFKTTDNTIGTLLHRMRREGYNLPKRK